jgi:hypothetical protein
MSNFTVVSDIPLVVGQRGRKPTDFPLDEMEAGQSFLIECDPSNKKTIESWRRKFLVAKKRFIAQYGEEFKFTTAVVAADEERGLAAGLRIWRTV